jgi:hypothetical protein
MVDRVIRTFPTAQPRDAVDAPGAQPVFICGMFRSGSTLAEQILGRHSAITPGGEIDNIPALSRRLDPYPEAVAALTEADITRLRDDYLGALPPGGIVTDKRCDNFLHIGLIKRLFPNARIIHTRREPLDNLLSIYFLYFGREVPYGNSLAEAAHFYVQYRRMMAHWQALYPDDIYHLDYDQLVAAPRAAIGGVLDFLGLPWEDACLTAQLASGAIRTASVWQTRKPLHARSSGRWRHYERHLGDVRRMLGEAGVRNTPADIG